MSRKSISTFLMVMFLVGMISACAHKQQPAPLAAPNALEDARARAASQQVQEPAVPARTSSYGKSNYIK